MVLSTPVVAMPSIITTSPTASTLDPKQKRKSTYILPKRLKPTSPLDSPPTPSPQKSIIKEPSCQDQQNRDVQPNIPSSHVTFHEPGKVRGTQAPPAYGDEANSALALPVTRLSESSRSDESSGDHGVFATTTTTHTVSTTTTTFWRLPRRKKDKGPLFPLPSKLELPDQNTNITPRTSTSGRPSGSPIRHQISRSNGSGTPRGSPIKDSSPSSTILAASSVSFAAPGSTLLRTNSTASGRSTRSFSAMAPPFRLTARDRSSTVNSSRLPIDDEHPPTPSLPQSTRTSTSTTGRASLGGLFNLSKLRHSSEPIFHRNGTGMPGTPGTARSNQNSISLPRDPPVVIPERQEGDTPAKYLARLEEVVSRGMVVALLSKSADDFSKNVLRSYMRRFKFFEDPLDMAVRKLLMQVELPKETQQIDRTLQSFADRYHECNPGIYSSSGMLSWSIIWSKLTEPFTDEAYFVAFSILILHTDVFNRNNKHKMQKADYTKNTRGQGVPQDILECFYDNISYTPFIHVEDDVDINGERIIAQRSRKHGFKGPVTNTLKKNTNDPVDPYTLILDNRLDVLRPSLDDVLIMNDPFHYMGSGNSFNVTDLHRTFFRSGVIQIVSSRSRPDAFKSQATITNPSEAQVGVVDMKVTKVGILWRKDTKRKKARSPWQEWGAILTGSKLYFFRNASWVRSLIHQHESHHKHGRPSMPVIFKPPLEQFKPDFLLSTEDVVTLTDSNYKKHKHAFVFARQNIYEEVFLADSEPDMNDWLAKLNYAAAFRTAGVRMRGVIGSHFEGQSNETQETEPTASMQSLNGPSGEVAIRKRPLNEELAQQIMMARRQILGQKIEEANEKLAATTKQLDSQLRIARHLDILAPIQQKTREQLIFSAFRLASSIRWARIELWRIRCHRDILSMDLEEDIKINSSTPGQVLEQSQTNMTSSSGLSQPQSKTAFTRLSSRASSIVSAQNSPRANRPAPSPSGSKLLSMDEIFRSPSRIPAQHTHNGSWELPHLAFDGPVTKQGYSRSPDGRVDQTSETTRSETTPMSATNSTDMVEIAAQVVQSAGNQEEEEHEMLVEAGLLSPESTVSEPKPMESMTDDDKSKVPDKDLNDSLSKVRHSLNRKLQNSHVPTHHRSRKGKDSSSSAGMTEDNASVKENEGLARSTGSFTVHGKKASVITFGSEWQNVPPEERLKLHKQQAQAGESKISISSTADEDNGGATANGAGMEARPASSISVSTATTTAKSFQQAWSPDYSGHPVQFSEGAVQSLPTDASVPPLGP